MAYALAKKATTIDEIKKRAVPILKKERITGASVFGSAVRGELNENSDIDILIDFDRPMTLLDFVGIQQELAEALGRKVDLVTRRSVYPPLKKYIEKEEMPIL